MNHTHSICVALATSSIFITSSQAAVDIKKIEGQYTQTFKSARSSKLESCKILRSLPNESNALNRYTFSDQHSDKEKDLCSVDFYNDSRIGICAKNASTNPATEAFLLDGSVSKEVFETKECAKNDDNRKGGKKITKFKSSVTCSYTPSILGYYQLSKYFDGMAHVPSSVARTMATEDHRIITERGLKTEIKIMWDTFARAHARPENFPSTMTEDGFVFGALTEKAKSTAFYSEFYGTPKTHGGPIQAFQKTKAYLDVTSDSSIQVRNPGTSLKEVAQSMQAALDMSNLIVMDFIMNQQDRFGNVEYRPYYQWMNQGKMDHKAANPKDLELKKLMDSVGAVVVKELVLADNDCGVKKDNRLKSINAHLKIRHIHPQTYAKIQELALKIKTPEFQNYFKNELQMTEEDLNSKEKGVANNILLLAKTLKANCTKGLLKQDLDIAERMNGYPKQHYCM